MSTYQHFPLIALTNHLWFENDRFRQLKAGNGSLAELQECDARITHLSALIAEKERLLAQI